MESKNTAVKVFSIWELLELILLQLDMRTLLISQRVCSTWHDTIAQSKAIQQALFFRPVENCPRKDNNGTQHRRINPLLEDFIWPSLSWYERVQKDETISLDERNRHYSYARKESFLKEITASWRRMLIQQPPTSKIGILNLYPSWMVNVKLSRYLTMPNGDHLRMDALFYLTTCLGLRPCFERRVLDHKNTYGQGRHFKDTRERMLKRSVQDCDLVVITFDNPPSTIPHLEHWWIADLDMAIQMIRDGIPRTASYRLR